MKPPAATAGAAVRWIHERASFLNLDYTAIHAASSGPSYQRIANYFVRDTLATAAVPLLAGPLQITDEEQLALYRLIAADRESTRAPSAEA